MFHSRKTLRGVGGGEAAQINARLALYYEAVAITNGLTIGEVRERVDRK